MARMNALEMYEKVQKARQIQQANMQTEKFENHVGETFLVTGIEITEGIQINSLLMDKVTLICKDGTTLSGFHKAGVEAARDIIDIVGDSPYPWPLIISIEAMTTKWGSAYYPVLEGVDLPADFNPEQEEVKAAAEQATADFLKEIESEQLDYVKPEVTE